MQTAQKIGRRRVRSVWRVICLLLVVGAALAAGCGEDEPIQSEINTNDPGDTTPPSWIIGARDADGADALSPDADEAPQRVSYFDCPDDTPIAAGWNTVTLDGVARRYHIDLPGAGADNAAMLFGFHGFSGSISPTSDAEHFRNELWNGMGLNPDRRADFPFILVLMEDTNLQPLDGLDWDLRTDDPNVDLPYFEAIVGCLSAHLGADQQKVFALGFSAGATFANLIHSKYPHILRAFISESGLWANQEDNLRIAHEVTAGVALIDWDWPALQVVEPGAAAVLLTRGGPRDTIQGVGAPADLDEAGMYARDWLHAMGRVVIDCPHRGGHILHPGVGREAILAFFAAHQHPGVSPLLDNDLAELPNGCEILRP